MPGDADPRSVGERIERLLDASAAAGPLVRERAEELVRLVAELYASGLERLLDLTYDTGVLSDELVERIVNDDVLSGLLLVHDLHPYDVATRVARAVDAARVSTGAEIELVAIEAETVRVRMTSSGCGTAAAEASVRDAIIAAAPEIEAVEVSSGGAQALISLDSLSSRLHAEASPIAGQ